MQRVILKPKVHRVQLHPPAPKPKRKAQGSFIHGVPFVPTPAQRNMVAILSSTEIPQANIAELVISNATKKPISIPTLLKYFPDEIRDGHHKTKALVIGKLNGLLLQGVPSAIYFYLKTRCGWRERDHDPTVGDPTVVAARLRAIAAEMDTVTAVPSSP